MFFNKKKPQPGNIGFNIPVTAQPKMDTPPSPPPEMDTRYQNYPPRQNMYPEPDYSNGAEEDNINDNVQYSISIKGSREWVERVISQLNLQ